MTPTDLITAKIRSGFDHLDADDNGVLDEHDHVLMGQRQAAALGLPADSSDARRIADSYLRLWREVHLPNVPEGRTAIPRDEFVASTRTLADDPAAAQATLGAVARVFLEIADLDADGRISPREFQLYQQGHCPGLSEADIATAFAHLDVDGDGYLSPEEFVSATVDYWTSADPDAPGNWWLGPQPGITG